MIDARDVRGEARECRTAVANMKLALCMAREEIERVVRHRDNALVRLRDACRWATIAKQCRVRRNKYTKLLLQTNR